MAEVQEEIRVINVLPYWIHVLTHYEKHGYISNGLTIPFLVGCRSKIEPNSDLFSIKELLLDFAESSGVTLMTCTKIGEIVVGSLDIETKQVQKAQNLYRSFGNIIITDNSMPGIKDFQRLTDALEVEYGDIVNDGAFSFEAGQWQDFSQLDCDRLAEVYSKLANGSF